SWKAYVEGNAAQPTKCAIPTLGSTDAQTPTPQEAFVTWRDPFLYFHSVIDDTSCAERVVGIDQLAPELRSVSKTPSLAYIIPDRCHDGANEPCLQRPGLVAADAFLAKVVPEIERSPSYKAGGLIAITFDQAPQTGPEADSGGCCNSPAYPNLPPATAGPPAAPSGEAGSAGPSGAPGIEATNEPAGGGRVGLLLLSKYVKPGSIDVIGQYNHFSLLAAVEDLFGLPHLGYADTPGLLGFDRSVYTAW
ncbi:MAG: hypothetical protein QOC91_1092, partial [Solirubrobacteraceae bacterium]|nr:hypothetical protein [Solirubrobacteraceae bacterium]